MAITGDSTIDIPLLKIVDWLAERKFLQSQWRAKNKALQVKAADLSQALPPELQAFKGLKDYLQAKALRDQLIQGAEKNFLGQYKGDAGVWDKLVRAYEIENIHIGETALQLIRNGEYEIPFLQTQISKQQQQLVDYEKKEAEYSRMALNAQKNHIQECSSLGIEGSDIPKELRSLTRQLPKLLFEGANQLKHKHLREAVQHYSEFTRHISQDRAKTSEASLLPIITEIQSTHLEPPQTEDAEPDTPVVEDAEDRGGGGESHGEVDWEVEMDVTFQDGQSGGIDWDIDTGAEETGIAIETVETQEESPRHVPGDVMSRLVDDTTFRSAASIELAELFAFVKQRCSELSSGSQQTLMAAAPASLQQTSLSALQQMASKITECQTVLASEKVKMLTSLKTSPHYFSRTMAALEQQAGQESKFYRLQRELQAKQQELQAKLVEDASTLSKVIAETKELKNFVEKHISQLCKGCTIQITGDLNNTLMK